jgi:hypothetical protein
MSFVRGSWASSALLEPSVTNPAESQQRLLRRTIRNVYERYPNHMLPYIGECYETPRADEFRVAVVGINAYGEGLTPECWPEWFRCGSHRFFGPAYREAHLLAEALSTDSSIFGALRYRADMDSKPAFYATNAIKTFMPSEFKKAEKLTAEDYRRHVDQWESELAALSFFDAFPHLVVVYGKEAYKWTWPSVWKTESGSVRPLPGYAVSNWREAAGIASGYSFGFRVRYGEFEHEVLFVYLNHPSSQHKRRAEWLLGQEGFRILAGLA